MSRVRQISLRVALLGLLALVMVACAQTPAPQTAPEQQTEGQTAEETTAAPQTATQAPPTGAAQPADPRLTTLIIGVAFEPQTFDPHVNVAAVSGYRFYPNIYESLLQYAPDGSLQPMLAESWEILDDGMRYRFELRQDVQFSDGTPFNAEAVKASFDRFLTLGEGFVAMFAALDEVVVVDEYTVDFRLKEPFSPILSVLASWQSAIFVSPTAVEQNTAGDDFAKGWLHDHTAGTGPFILESWEPENRIVMTRNPYYREPVDSNATQRIVYQIVREPATLRQLIEGGDIDIAEELTPSLVEPLRNAEGVEVAIDVTHGSSYGQVVIFNQTKEPFNDPNFRRAIAYSIDYDRLLTVWQDIAVMAQGPFPETFTPWFSPEDVVTYNLDPEKAEQYLNEAGYSLPIAPPLNYQIIWQTGQTAQRDMASLIQEDLAKIGINLEIVETEIPVWRQAVWDRTFDLAFIQLPLRYNDPDSLLSLNLHSREIREQAWNPGYRNTRVDELIDQGREETDPERRLEIYKELQRIVTDEVAILFLVNKRHAYAYGSNVTGIVWNPNYGPHFRGHEISKTGAR